MQKVVVPTSQKGIVDENGFPSRQLQALLNALQANSVPVTHNTTTGATTGAVVLLPIAATVPSGWQTIETVTLGGSQYHLITQV